MSDGGWQQIGLAALRETLDVDGHTRKAMIEYLFSEGFWDAERLSWDGAVARWNDCLNPTKTAFFKLGELWALMRKFGRHHLLLAMADDLGYELRMKPTEERRQALLVRIADTLTRTECELALARDALAQLEQGQPSVAVMAGNPTPRFDLNDRDVDVGTGVGGF